MKYTVKKGIINDILAVNGEVFRFSKGVGEVIIRFAGEKHFMSIHDKMLFLDEEQIGLVFYDEEKNFLQRYRAIRAEFALPKTKWEEIQNSDRSFLILKDGNEYGCISKLTRGRIETKADSLQEAAFLYAVAVLMFHEDDLDIV